MKNKMLTVNFYDYGGPEKLRLEETSFPPVESGKILIEVRAADVNPYEIKLEEGMFRETSPVKFPYTPGADIAGVVREVGSKVSKFHPGDEIFGFIDVMRGGYSQYVVSSPAHFALKPEKASMIEAASLPQVGTTAWQGIFEHGMLKEGQKVLIHGASGGVGGMAVQLARWKDAQIFATCAKEHISYVRSLGADTVIDYESQLFEDVADQVDLVLDVIGGDVQKRSMECLKKGGRLVSTVGISEAELAKKKDVKAIAMGMYPSFEILEKLADLFDRHVIKTHISHSFPLEQARLAQETLKGGRGAGKIVLNVTEALH